MARNGDSASRQSGGSRRVSPAGPARAATRTATRSDRRRFWIRVVAGLLVLAMLLPVMAGIISVL